MRHVIRRMDPRVKPGMTAPGGMTCEVIDGVRVAAKNASIVNQRSLQ